MKITVAELAKIVQEETNKTLKENNIDEGVLDLIKGAGKGLGKAAGDVKNSGLSSSLQADIQKAVQQSGLFAQKFTRTFEDLLARAQALHLNNEEEEVKAELQALQTYMETAAQTNSGAQSNKDSSIAPADVQTPKEAPSPVDFSEPTVSNKTVPSTVDLPPKPSPKPVKLSPDKPLDWRAGSKSKGPAVKKKKIAPRVTKDMIKKTYQQSNSDPRETAKRLGLTLQQLHKIMTAPEKTAA